jgi:hypothetical protein
MIVISMALTCSRNSKLTIKYIITRFTRTFNWFIYSVNIKFGTKFIIALCDVFRKIARVGRFYFEKCHHVACNLFKWRHWFLRNDFITNFFKWERPLFSSFFAYQLTSSKIRLNHINFVFCTENHNSKTVWQLLTFKKWLTKMRDIASTIIWKSITTFDQDNFWYPDNIYRKLN